VRDWVVTQRDLHKRLETYSPLSILYFLAEIAIACDLAEVLGMAMDLICSLVFH
jgi:Mn2+/Fe2+ NRAMP family transporter